MIIVVTGGIRVLDHDHFVIQHHGVPRRAFRAHVRRCARNDHVFDAHLLQIVVQIRGSDNERRKTALGDEFVVILDVKIRIKFVARVSGAELSQVIVTFFFGEEVLFRSRKIFLKMLKFFVVFDRVKGVRLVET